MKSFTVGNIVFQHYIDSPEHTEAHNELWASCPACGHRERVARAVNSGALAQVLAEDYAYGPYRHTCDEAQWQ